jgi:C-terminal processing protease CtpA/Prc
MRKTNSLTLFAAVIALMLPAASVHANMAPPEPFALEIGVAADKDGLRITAVPQGSRAENGGLKVGDIILGIDGRYVKSFTPSEQKNAVAGLHTWHAELIIVRNHRDIMTVKIRA